MRKRVKNTASELPKTSLFSCTFYTEMLVTAIFYKKQKATTLIHVHTTFYARSGYTATLKTT